VVSQCYEVAERFLDVVERYLALRLIDGHVRLYYKSTCPNKQSNQRPSNVWLT
jgi:hypothetical protein